MLSECPYSPGLSAPAAMAQLQSLCRERPGSKEEDGERLGRNNFSMILSSASEEDLWVRKSTLVSQAPRALLLLALSSGLGPFQATGRKR